MFNRANVIRDVSLIASAFISFNFYHFSRPGGCNSPPNAREQRVEEEGGEGENVGESNGGMLRGGKKKEEEGGKGKQTRGKNSRIRARETCWFISFWVENL